MKNEELIESLVGLKEISGLDRNVIMSIIESSLESIVKKQFGDDTNINIIANPNSGELEIWKVLTVVADGELVNKNNEIELLEARNIESDFEIGEECSVEIKLDDIYRRNILNLKQNLNARIIEWQNNQFIGNFNKLIGEIIEFEVRLIRKDMVIGIDDFDNEVVLMIKDKLYSDYFKRGQRVIGSIKSVSINKGKPQIFISRVSSSFLEKILHDEISHISEGLITIKSIAREPGFLSKVVVDSYDDNIDPVGIIVGKSGSRIKEVNKKLGGEPIDIIRFTNNRRLYLSRLLKIEDIQSLEESEDTIVINLSNKLDSSILTKRLSVNIKLASIILGKSVIIERDIDEEDVDLDEFSDEIEGWVIEHLKSIGLNTAKSIINMDIQTLSKITDLEDETISELLVILKSEFE
jgi:N utilization substance protein A